MTTTRGDAVRTMGGLARLGLLLGLVGWGVIATGQRDDQPGGPTIVVVGWVVVAVAATALFVTVVAHAVRLGILAAREG
ncbi:MAG TPA: hypothetical protein VGE77_08400 [Nocardioides sp.]